MEADFEKAKTKAGYLEKKATSMFAGFQERYWMIMQDGQMLFYFDKMPTADTKPKGGIDLVQVTKVEEVGKKEFIIHHPIHSFDLRAKTTEERDSWIKSLQIVVQYLKEHNDPSSDGRSRTSTSTGGYKLANMDAQTREKAQAELEKKTVTDNQKQAENSKTHIPDDKILKVKGFQDYFVHIDESVLKKRVIYGWLEKRSKGTVKYFQTRWFIMVSAKPIYKDAELDEEILNENQLPVWMEPETIYYFDDMEIEDPEAKFLGALPVKDIVTVSKKDMLNSKDKGYTFKLDRGDRVDHLKAKYVIDMQKWVEAIEASMKTIKEKEKSISGHLTINVDKIVQIFDKEGLQKFKEKMEMDFKKVQAEYELADSESVGDWLRQADELAKKLIGILDGCLAYEPPRKDIIQEYIEFFHEGVAKLLQEYYTTQCEKIQNLDLIQLINWLVKYQDQLKPYGLNDSRLSNSVEVLSNIYTKKLLKLNTPIALAILKRERDEKPKPNDEGRIESTGPYDLFKMITETFEGYHRCKHHLVAIKLVRVCREIITFYQNTLELLIEKLVMTNEQLIGFCNGTINFIRLTNEFSNTELKSAGLSEEEVEKEFSKDDLLKRFTDISKKAQDRLIDATFKNLNKYFRVNYMDLKLLDVLESIFNELSYIINACHKTYQQKVWKSCLEKITILYTQCLLNSAGKIPKQSGEQLKEKLREEIDLFKGAFKDVLGANMIASSVKVLSEILDFLDAGSSMISVAVIQLRKSNGPAFNIKKVTELLNLRVDIIDRQERNDILQSCKDVLAKVKDDPKDKKTQKNFFDKLEVEQDVHHEDDIIEDSAVHQEAAEDDESNHAQVEEQKINETVEAKVLQRLGIQSYEGFLYKKNSGFIVAWNKYWFSIKKGKLYWYDDERAKRAEGFIKISEIKSVDAIEIDRTNLANIASVADVANMGLGFVGLQGQKYQFDIEFTGKTMHLQAESSADRDMWVQCLQELSEEEIRQQNRAMIRSDLMANELFANIQGASLFEDKEPEWTPPIEEQERLLIKERPGKPNRIVDKGDPNRRKSIVLDDIATVDLGDSIKNHKEKPTPTEESEDAPLRKPVGAFDIEHKGIAPSRGGLCFTLYMMMGLESLLPADDHTKYNT